jgi:hypothetical protein
MQTTDHFSYDEYDRLTRAYADEHGGVNYSGLKKKLAALKDFIDQLEFRPQNSENPESRVLVLRVTTT